MGVRDSSLEVPGSAFISNQCGGTIYNLSSLASTDIIGTGGPASNPTQYNYVINLCGTVRSTRLCLQNNSVNASVCQVDTVPASGYGYPLASWNPIAYPVVWQYNGNGVSQIIQDGFACGGEERLTNITLVCNPAATTPIWGGVVENPDLSATNHSHCTCPTKSLVLTMYSFHVTFLSVYSRFASQVTTNSQFRRLQCAAPPSQLLSQPAVACGTASTCRRSLALTCTSLRAATTGPSDHAALSPTPATAVLSSARVPLSCRTTALPTTTAALVQIMCQCGLSLRSWASQVWHRFCRMVRTAAAMVLVRVPLSSSATRPLPLRSSTTLLRL